MTDFVYLYRRLAKLSKSKRRIYERSSTRRIDCVVVVCAVRIDFRICARQRTFDNSLCGNCVVHCGRVFVARADCQRTYEHKNRRNVTARQLDAVHPTRLATNCGSVGALLGIAGLYLMPDFPATDIVNALAVGIVSGFAATGINQIYKQATKTQP